MMLTYDSLKPTPALSDAYPGVVVEAVVRNDTPPPIGHAKVKGSNVAPKRDVAREMANAVNVRPTWKQCAVAEDADAVRLRFLEIGHVQAIEEEVLPTEQQMEEEKAERAALCRAVCLQMYDTTNVTMYNVIWIVDGEDRDGGGSRAGHAIAEQGGEEAEWERAARACVEWVCG